MQRRSFLGVLIGLPFAGVGPKFASELPIRVRTLNHVSFDCADLRKSVEWYGRVLGMPVHAHQDYLGGQTVVRVGKGPSYIALSQKTAETKSALPHFCWGIDNFNVDRILRALSEMEAPAQAILREGKTVNGVNFSDPDGFPLQFNPVNACGGTGFFGDVCDPSAQVTGAVPVRTLNHVRLLVPNVEKSLAWYRKLTAMPIQDGPPNVILRVGDGPQFVALQQGSGPEAYRPRVGLGVENFNPDRVMAALGEQQVQAHVIKNAIIVEAPDEVEIHLQDAG